ncbi:hypothetical protein CCHR01_02949 [Colletotrichum chrysophilum]|uniref:Uncharacterized protein n=1 Tax=Colletotrichum chrysophilum TaxID=1836956 RepID=A0AAD9EN64_9PEZI|nr:hypothetical protein CCHR01_02949 [Colletotrichum chrysophilum]
MAWRDLVAQIFFFLLCPLHNLHAGLARWAVKKRAKN